MIAMYKKKSITLAEQNVSCFFFFISLFLFFSHFFFRSQPRVYVCIGFLLQWGKSGNVWVTMSSNVCVIKLSLLSTPFELKKKIIIALTGGV